MQTAAVGHEMLQSPQLLTCRGRGRLWAALQLLPSHRCEKETRGPLAIAVQASVAGQETPMNGAFPNGPAPAGCSFHAVPSQCSISPGYVCEWGSPYTS